MMKLLHSADWHLDSPIQGRTESQTGQLKDALMSVPKQITALAKAEGCDLILLSGDLFDGPFRPDTLAMVQRVLADAGCPVFIVPGNHDPFCPGSPWMQPGWPENVHIFTGAMTSIPLPHLDCRVYGAAFQRDESPALLEGFRAECGERYAIGMLHGDPTQLQSPHNPITRLQVQESGLDYLALGHIHKTGSFQTGSTLCAWPGCPMGRGFDELGDKGVFIVTLDGGCEAKFVPLNVPRFHWLHATPDTLAQVLPAVGNRDFYRIDLTGESEPLDIQLMAAAFPGFPNLQLRDQTVPPLDLWANAGADTLEGVFFQLLQEADADEETIQLAARISRQILLGQEVELP